MPPIRVHHTDTTDTAWDGPANEARLRTDESEAYYRQAYAWQDPDGDPETKAAYKFIHHVVGSDGEIGAANVRACITGIAVLNGARGGADISDGDRRGVWEHLAAHLKDADIEPPELRSSPLSGREERSIQVREMRLVGEGGQRKIVGYAALFNVLSPPLWGRLVGEGGQRKIVGYAALFNVLSPPLWGFRERIQPGAFSKTIREADVRALWNHDSNLVLGRTKNGTLRLKEDDVGLGIEINPPDTQWARDALVSIDRGDVDQMSFSFEAVRETWGTESGHTVRTLEEVKLFDVSPVTFPAYPQTSVQLRSIIGMELRDLASALNRLAAGSMTEADLRLLEDFIRQVEGRLTAAPAEGGHPAASGADDVQVRARLARLRRELELAEIQ